MYHNFVIHSLSDDNLEGWDRVGGGREIQEGGAICIPMAVSCWCMAEINTYCEAIFPQLKINKFIKKKKPFSLQIPEEYQQSSLEVMYLYFESYTTYFWIKWYCHMITYFVFCVANIICQVPILGRMRKKKDVQRS